MVERKREDLLRGHEHLDSPCLNPLREGACALWGDSGAKDLRGGSARRHRCGLFAEPFSVKHRGRGSHLAEWDDALCRRRSRDIAKRVARSARSHRIALCRALGLAASTFFRPNGRFLFCKRGEEGSGERGARRGRGRSLTEGTCSNGRSCGAFTQRQRHKASSGRAWISKGDLGEIFGKKRRSNVCVDRENRGWVLSTER